MMARRVMAVMTIATARTEVGRFKDVAPVVVNTNCDQLAVIIMPGTKALDQSAVGSKVTAKMPVLLPEYRGHPIRPHRPTRLRGVSELGPLGTKRIPPNEVSTRPAVEPSLDQQLAFS